MKIKQTAVSLISLVLASLTSTATAENGNWVFLHQSPPDELLTGTESGYLSELMVLGGELVFNKTYSGNRKILASDGTVLGSYTKIDYILGQALNLLGRIYFKNPRLL